MERRAVFAQPVPLPVAVDQDATLIEDAVEQKRCLRLYSPQISDVYPATADALQADGQPKASRGPIVSERDQQVKVRARILVAPRQRAVEHGKANPMLSPQRPTKRREKRPVCLQVLALAERQLKPARSGSVGAQGTLTSSSAQSALLDVKVGC